MNIELSSVALKLINDLYRTGLFGATPEDTARQLVEEGLRKYCPIQLTHPAFKKQK